MRLAGVSRISKRAWRWAIIGLCVLGMYLIAHAVLQRDVMRCILEIGDLAAVPRQARISVLRTNGNMFARTYHLTFRADRKVIQKWIGDSKGLRAADVTRADDTVNYVRHNGVGKADESVKVSVNWKLSSVDVHVSEN